MEPTSTQTTVSRRLDRPVDEVWDQLTTADGFERWMGPGSTIDSEPGGDLIAADPESGEPKIGRVLDVEPGRRLRWVWRPLGGEESTEVLVVLEPDSDKMGFDVGQIDSSPDVPGTLVTVTERPSTIGIASACAVGMASNVVPVGGRRSY